MINRYSNWRGSLEQYLFIENEIKGYLNTVSTKKINCHDIDIMIELIERHYRDYVLGKDIVKINKILFLVNQRKTKQSGKQIAQEIYEYKLYKETNKYENKIKNKTTKKL
tara:strand:+ start:245 stop:574 length:330 start_codon:yes stop_codon:yes gene_type:complete